MKPLFILAIVVLPVAACSGNKGSSNSTNAAGVTADAAASAPASVEAAITGDVGIQPGLWETRVMLEEVEMPGAPPAALEQMKQTVAARAERTCFTPQDVANMSRRMFEAGNEGSNCDFSNQTFAGGRIDVAGTCQNQGSSVEMTMQGTYTSTTMTTRNDIRTSAAPGQTVHMVVSSNSQRVGECPAGAANPKS